MLSLLMRDKDFQVIKVALTIEAPWPSKNLFRIRMAALLFTHDGAERGMIL
jgi:hypothetical protein